MIEARFQAVYLEGALDPGVWISQGWKTAPVVKNLRMFYEGEGRILKERFTVR